MQCVHASLSRASWVLPARPSSCSSSKCISFFSFSFHVMWRYSAPSQVCRSVRCILGIPSLGLRLLINREPPDFNRHVRRYSSGPRRRRNPARYGISKFRSRYVNDPVAQQKLLRLGENTVCDRNAVFLPANNLSFSRFG